MEIFSSKFLNISGNVISSQSRFCLAQIQLGYKIIYLRAPGSLFDQRAPVELHLFAPRQTRDSEGMTLGYRRKGFYLRIGGFKFGRHA